MKIHIAAGLGIAPTKLSAFDVALNDAGVSNYNLIRLSSIIPPQAELQIHDGPVPVKLGEWGDKLYVVMAEVRVNTPNAEAWAGIGWVQDKKTGKGLFVEHEGTNEKTVRRDIRDSLKSLMKTRKMSISPISMKVTGITCTHEPVCAMVIAAFEARGWDDQPE